MIELHEVWKVFPNGVEAVVGVDLTVGDGEFVVLLGPSGSGKSTLLRVVAGLESPTSGTVRIGGRDVTAMAPRERDVAMVFQESALYPHLNVFKNLAFGLRARGTAWPETRERVGKVAASLGLSDLLTRRPATLSGGQRRRVALGRAVARRPAAFLLDEPLTGLDAPLRASLRGDLIGLKRHGAAVLSVTHDQAEALATGDRVAVMDRGRVVQVGPPHEVYGRPASRFVAGFLGSPPMSFLPCRVSAQGGSVRLTPEGTADGSSFEAPQGRLAGMLATRSGQRVELGLRPEDVALADPSGEPAPGPSLLWLPAPAELTRVEFCGHETLATLALGASEVTARVPATAPLRPGDRFAVGFDPVRSSWFDAETGLALA